MSVQEALSFQLDNREGSGFILDSGSGAYGILQYWLSFDGLLVVGGLVAAFLVMLRPRTRPIGAAVLLAAAVAMRPDGYLPFMYVTVALPFCALAIAAVADHAWSVLRAPARRARQGHPAPPTRTSRWRWSPPHWSPDRSSSAGRPPSGRR